MQKTIPVRIDSTKTCWDHLFSRSALTTSKRVTDLESLKKHLCKNIRRGCFWNLPGRVFRLVSNSATNPQWVRSLSRRCGQASQPTPRSKTHTRVLGQASRLAARHLVEILDRVPPRDDLGPKSISSSTTWVESSHSCARKAHKPMKPGDLFGFTFSLLILAEPHLLSPGLWGEKRPFPNVRRSEPVLVARELTTSWWSNLWCWNWEYRVSDEILPCQKSS